MSAVISYKTKMSAFVFPSLFHKKFSRQDFLLLCFLQKVRLSDFLTIES